MFSDCIPWGRLRWMWAEELGVVRFATAYPGPGSVAAYSRSYLGHPQ